MKKQGYKDRLHESLGERHKGSHKQSLKSRSHESEGMEKKANKGKFAGVKTMDHYEHMKHAMMHMKEAHKKCKMAKGK